MDNIAAITPIPYEVFTIASIIGRGFRFFLVAWLIQHYGAKIRPFIGKYLEWVLLAVTVVGVGGFVALNPESEVDGRHSAPSFDAQGLSAPGAASSDAARFGTAGPRASKHGTGCLALNLGFRVEIPEVISRPVRPEARAACPKACDFLKMVLRQ